MSSGRAAALRTMEPLCCGEIGVDRAAAPDGPVVAAAHDGVAVRQVQLRERAGEAVVLLQRVVTGSAVEPDERVRALQARGRSADRQLRAVPLHERAVTLAAEHGGNVIGDLVAGPALDDMELAGVVDRD